jgi:putative colanic acid biosynthesis acetyltransferase WcaF
MLITLCSTKFANCPITVALNKRATTKQMKTKLASFNNDWYLPGRSVLVRFLWILVSVLFVQCNWNPFSFVRVWLLRLFGAKIGAGVILKPGVQIKYPWLLTIADAAWIGEHVWIDNLAQVTIGANVCISQGAFLLTGNHNYTKSSFDLMVKPIVLEEGVWIGAKSVVCPGVTCKSHAVLTVGSVARNELSAYRIYSGNPAKEVKERVILS